MRFFDQLGYAGNSIKTRKARAGLTTLGITIGIAAIVALLALSNGFQASIEEQFELGFSTNVLFVTKNTGGYGETADPNFQLYINDSDTISGLSPHINLVVPRLAQPVGGCNITVGGKNYTIGSVMGVNFTKFNDLYPTTFATTNGSIPIEDSNTSVVIGYKYGQDPYNYKVGDNITLTWYDHNLKGNPILNASHTYNATVAAILPEIGGFGLGGPSDSGVYIQLTPAIDAFQSNVSMSIGIRIDSDEQSVIDEVIAAIKSEYNTQVNIISSTAILNTINGIFNFISVFIAAIAGVSLVVAGIMIMNVQITSVMERTREIGILKAIGAKDRTVLSAFLFETLFIGILGSALGIGVGWILSWVLGNIMGGMMSGGMSGASQVGPFSGMGGASRNVTSTISTLNITPILTLDLIVWAVFFGVIVAIVFGLYPAYRASRLKPVDALRSE